MKLAGLLPCSMEVGGGSAVVLATRKAGSDLPYGLPSNLSPLPVSVHTHSLNLSNPILPQLMVFFFGFFLLFSFYFPTTIPPLNPFTVSVWLTYPVT